MTANEMLGKLKTMFSRKFGKILFLTLFNLAACAPMHIKEHQAAGIRGRCGFGSSQLLIADSPLTFYSVSAKHEKDDLVIEITMQGKGGDHLTILDSLVRIEMDGKTIAVPATVGARQVKKNDPRDGSRYEAWKVGVPYVFHSDEVYQTGSIAMEARIPFQQKDFKIYLPKIKVGDVEVPAHSKDFKFIDRWTITPLNGC